MNKKLLLVPTAAVAAAIAVGSIAYACTTVQGTASVTFGGNSGNACTSGALPQTNTSGYCDIDVSSTREMIATADNLVTSQSYFLYFLNDAARDRDGMNICMNDIDAKHLAMKSASASNGTGTGASVTPDSNGDIAATTRYVPAVIKHGTLFPEQDLFHTGVHNSTASVCWMTENKSYASEDVTVIVTGGPAGTP